MGHIVYCMHCSAKEQTNNVPSFIIRLLNKHKMTLSFIDLTTRLRKGSLKFSVIRPAFVNLTTRVQLFFYRWDSFSFSGSFSGRSRKS